MTMHGEETACLQDFNVPQSFVAGFEEQCRERIAGLQARSRQGLWGLTLFALLSAGIYAAPVSTALISPKMFDLLGPSPPVSLISLALVIYCFSALVLAMPRIVDGGERYRGWSMLGYVSCFYGFYFYAGALEVNFWAVFAVGALLLSLEYVGVLIHCRAAVREEKAAIERHRRLAEM